MIPLYHNAMNRMISRQDMDMVLTTMIESPDTQELLTETIDRYAAIIGLPNLYGIALANAREAYMLAFSTLAARFEAKGGALNRLLISPLAPAFIADILIRMNIEPLYYDVDPRSFEILVDAADLEASDALLLTGEGARVPEELPTICPIIEDLSYSFGSVGAKLGRGDILIMREGNPLMRTGGAALVMSTTKSIASELKKQQKLIAGDSRGGMLASDQQIAIMYTQLGAYAKSYKRFSAVAYELYQALYRSGSHPVGHWSKESHSGPFLQLIFDGPAEEVRAFIKKKKIELGLLAPEPICELLPGKQIPSGCDIIMQRGVSFPCYALLKVAEQEDLIRVLASLPASRGRA